MSKETTVKVNIDADLSVLEELNDLLEQLVETGEDAGSAVSDSLGDIETAASMTAMELDNVIESAEDAGSSLDNVSGAGLDDAASSASDLSGELDSATESAEQLVETTSTFSEGSMQWGAVSASMGDIAERVGSANNEFIAMNETVGMVAVNTGYSTGQVRELAGSYTEVGTSANDAAIFLQRMQNAGLEPNTAAMNDAMQNAHLLQTAFNLSGSEADALMGSLGRAGISAGELSESFNALGYISAETNISVDTFSSILTTSGANMDKYGVSTDVAAVALSKINSRYKTARQAGSAFNKAVEESHGDVAKLEELLDLEAGTLSNASEETAKAAGTVEELSASYENAQGITGQLGAAFDALKMQVSGPVGEISNLSAGLTGMFSGMSDVKATASMFKDLGSAMFGVDGKALKAGSSIASAGGKAATAGVEALGSVAGWIAAGASQAGAAISAGAFAIAGWAAASPILFLVIVIAALIAIFVILYFKSETVREAINWLGDQLKALGESIWNGLISALTGLYDWFVNLGEQITTFVTEGITSIYEFVMGGINAFIGFITYIAGLPGQLWGYLSNILSRISSWASNMISQVSSAARNFVSGFISPITQLPGKIGTEFTKILNKVKNIGSEIVAAAGNVASNIVKEFLGRLKIASPGIIQIKTVGEIQDTLDRFAAEAPNAKRAGKKVATSLVTGYDAVASEGVTDISPSSFANGSLISSNNNSGQNIQPVINIEIGSVDNEERIQEIVDAVTKALHWSNETAGRTI